MADAVTVAEAQAGDQDQILKMWEALTLDLPQHHFKPFGEPVISERADLLSEMFTNSLASQSAVVLKLQGERCVGTVSTVLNQQSGFTQSNSGVIYNLWVEPEFRRKGYATELVECAKTWLKEQGASSAQVGWHLDNVAADKFWKKLGFRNYEVIAASPL